MTFSQDKFYSQRQAALERDIDALLSPSICPFNPDSRSSSPDSDLSDQDSLFSAPDGRGRLVRRSSSVYSSASSTYSASSLTSSSPSKASQSTWGHRRQSSRALPPPPKLAIDTSVGQASFVAGTYIQSSTAFLSKYNTPAPLPTAYRNTPSTGYSRANSKNSASRQAMYVPPPPAMPPPPPPVQIDIELDEEECRPAPGCLSRRPTRRARSGSRQRSRSKGAKAPKDVPKRRGAVKRAGRMSDIGPEHRLTSGPSLSRKFSWEM